MPMNTYLPSKDEPYVGGKEDTKLVSNAGLKFDEQVLPTAVKVNATKGFATNNDNAR